MRESFPHDRTDSLCTDDKIHKKNFFFLTAWCLGFVFFLFRGLNEPIQGGRKLNKNLLPTENSRRNLIGRIQWTSELVLAINLRWVQWFAHFEERRKIYFSLLWTSYRLTMNVVLRIDRLRKWDRFVPTFFFLLPDAFCLPKPLLATICCAKRKREGIGRVLGTVFGMWCRIIGCDSMMCAWNHVQISVLFRNRILEPVQRRFM